MVSLPFLALSPVLLIVGLLLIKLDLRKAAPITFFYTAGLAYSVWRMQGAALLGSTLRGVLVGVDIVIIVFGAIFFLEFLKDIDVIRNVEYYLRSLSEDKRVQVLLLVWFFGSFLEGVAGFGTPAAIIAPLLVSLGFKPVKSVILALLGNSSAVLFGAVGTPVRIGFENIDITGVITHAAFVNIFVGILVPLLLLVVLLQGEKNWGEKFTEILPLGILAGVLLLLPTWLATFIGPEFPSLIGPVIGFVLFWGIINNSWLIPSKTLRIDEEKNSTTQKPTFSLSKTFLPYFLLVVSLGVGRATLGSTTIMLPGDILHTVTLFNPGLLFLITAGLCSFLYKTTKKTFTESLSKSANMTLTPFIVILFVTGFVEILLNTNSNMSGLASMVDVVTQSVPAFLLTSLSPFIGAFGSFITGSATVSNILFGPFLENAATEASVSSKTVLAGQLLGAGIGNMIALTNIVAAQAAVKIQGEETHIIRMLLPSALLLSATATLLFYLL